MTPPLKDSELLRPNPPTRNVTLTHIHTAYQNAIQIARNILEIPKFFYDELSIVLPNIPTEDKQFFFKFMAGVNTCHKERERTFQVSNFMTVLNILVCYIVCWINTTPDILKKSLLAEMFDFASGFKFDYDVFLILRRKALESELFKILKRSLRIDLCERNLESYPSIGELSATIRDRFGFLCIIQNTFKDKEEELKFIDVLRIVLNGILCEQDPELRTEFLKWLRGFASLDCVICETLLKKHSFSVGHFKDYARNPKGNYETQQWTCRVEHLSMDFGGLEFEFQLRTARMHENATNPNSPSAHYKHKDNFDSPEFKGLDIDILKKVIHIDNFSKVNIKGFTGYPSASSISVGTSTDNLVHIDPHEVTVDNDFDGIYLPKVVCSRRVSSQLVFFIIG